VELLFYVLKIRGYRYLGHLFPFKRIGHLKVTIYAIFGNLHNAKREMGHYKNWCDSVEVIETETLTKEIFLKQHSATAIFKGCEAKIPHQCKNDYPIHLWYDPASEGIGWFCEDAIREMAKERYPFREKS
jgi:hypothetical protein